MKIQKMTYANVFFAILCGFMVGIPWIVHLKLWELSDKMCYIFNHTNGIYLDLFLYYKEIAVILSGILVILFFLYEKIKLRKKWSEIILFRREKSWILVCMGIFLASVIGSALFSEDKYTTIWGIPSEGEGVFTMIGYVLLFFGMILFMRDEVDLRIFRYALRVLTVITIVLSCIEFFYAPLLEIPFFQTFLAGAEYKELIASIKNESFRNFVVLTFYNPNYFGGFCLLLIPFACRDLLASENLKQRILYGGSLAGLYFCVVAAKSTASFYLAIAEGVLLFILTYFLRKHEKKKLLLNVGVFFAGLAIVFGIAFAVNGERLETVVSGAAKNERYQELGIAKHELTDIQMEENKLVFYTKESVLTVVSEEGALMFYDTAGNPIGIQVTESEKGVLIEPDCDEFAGVTLTINGGLFAFDFGYESFVYFRVIENTFYGVGQNGQLFKTVSLGNMSERFGTEYYGLVTGRGYAWINTLPILKETLLLGKGAGNFALHFPQYDYVGLLNTHGTHSLVADKPHCAYLQIAVNHGVPALLAILVLFMGTGIGYIKVRFKAAATGEETGILDALFVMFVAFILYSVCNDSNVAVSSAFWMLFGVFVKNVNNCNYEEFIKKFTKDGGI